LPRRQFGGKLDLKLKLLVGRQRVQRAADVIFSDGSPIHRRILRLFP
jgi:hypothetical protein